MERQLAMEEDGTERIGDGLTFLVFELQVRIYIAHEGMRRLRKRLQQGRMCFIEKYAI